MSTDPLTIAAAAFVLIYAYGLGAAAVWVWRVERGPLRYSAGLATLVYYAAFFLAAPPSVAAFRAGEVYPPADAIRTIASSVAFGLSLLLLARRAKGNNDHR